MSNQAGTGGVDESSSDSEVDTVRADIGIEVFPPVVRAVRPPPHNLPVVVHSIQVTTPCAVVTIEFGGITTAPPDFLILVAEEILSAARSRLLTGQVEPVYRQ